MRKITKPFLLVNPKSYLYGEKSLELAKAADQAAASAEGLVDVFYTCCYPDLRLIRDNTEHVIVTAQHMDAIRPGRGQGYVLPEAIKDAGAEAVYMNHTEHALTLETLYKTMVRGRGLGLIRIVCVNSVAEGVAIATMAPEILVCEPSDLIGSGQKADDSYMTEAARRIHAVNPEVNVVIGASISSGQDCVRVISSGADGTGATSGIVKAPDPGARVKEMVKAMADYKREEMRKSLQ